MSDDVVCDIDRLGKYFGSVLQMNDCYVENIQNNV